MRNIVVVTSNRSEYGLLKNTIKKIEESTKLNLKLIVTGAHLSEQYGYTVDEIVNDNVKIYKRIRTITDNNSIAKQMAKLLYELDGIINEDRPDIILILGDRYEMLSVANAALVNNIALAHISGGEITEGAIDEQIRHSITKIANIHFPGTDEYANNIKNMGEESWRIFNVGDPGIENIRCTKLLNDYEIEKKIDFEVDKDTILVTFHPVTLEIERINEYTDNLIEALKKVNKRILFTYPNSDSGSDIIVNKILEYEKSSEKVKVCKNLGSLLYLSVMNKCGCIVGNSSSGIIEAPYMKKPVVNIGDRQKGRLMANNIVNCDYNTDNIIKAVNKAMSSEFEEFVKGNTVSLYGDGNTSQNIVKILEDIEINKNLLCKKLLW